MTQPTKLSLDQRIRATLRALSLFVFLIFYLILVGILHFFLGPNLSLKPKGWILIVMARMVLGVLGISVQSKGHPIRKDQCVYVSNHISFLDILVLSSLRPLRYITSVEMREQWVGLITDLAGCLYTERRKKDPESTMREIESVAYQLNHTPVPIVLFAEGTSSSGDHVLPFKGRFFESIQRSKVPIQCIALHFVDRKTHQRLPAHDLRRVAFYGEMTLKEHFINLLLQDGCEAQVHHIEVIHATLELDRSDLKNRSYAAISTHYFALGEKTGSSGT